ncbi:MAG: hypothetical protein PVI50_05165 [Gammaproteobacteria bacterium]|jgi:hypothetical protein
MPQAARVSMDAGVCRAAGPVREKYRAGATEQSRLKGIAMAPANGAVLHHSATVRSIPAVTGAWNIGNQRLAKTRQERQSRKSSPCLNPAGWDAQELRYKDMLFAKAETRGIFHISLNTGAVNPRTIKAFEQAHAIDWDQVTAISSAPSAWRGERRFAFGYRARGTLAAGCYSILTGM